MPANPEVERYIRERALAYGIDPNVAVAVSRAEALNVFDPNRPDLGGDDRSSFGPFQLHYAGMSKRMPNRGLGDAFTEKTGLHASDPSTWRQQVDFALSVAAKDGWRQWMGAANTGIGRWAGITRGAGDSVSPYTVAGPEGKTAKMQGPIEGRHPPNPTVSASGEVKPGAPGYGVDYTGGAAGAETPIAAAAEPDKPKTWRDRLHDFGNAIGDIDFSAMATPYKGAAIPAQPGAANFTATPPQRPQQPQGGLDQRQQLALLMQRLNQGVLF